MATTPPPSQVPLSDIERTPQVKRVIQYYMWYKTRVIWVGNWKGRGDRNKKMCKKKMPER